MVKKALCICEICNCGRHHCVHKPSGHTTTQPRCLLTEYKQTYRNFDNIQRTKPIKPDASTQLSKDPFDGSTMYNQTFVAYDYEAPKKKAVAAYTKQPVTFDHVSSYKRDYIPKRSDKVKSARPDYKMLTGDRPFSATTVHKQTYQPWDVQRTQSIRPRVGAIGLPGSKFDYQTTFQHDFPSYDTLGRQTIKPPEPSLQVGQGVFASDTTTRSDYTKKHVQVPKSAKPVQAILQNNTPFNNITTFQTSFPWPEGYVQSESCKPPAVPLHSMEPFQDSTTHQETYRPWTSERRHAWKPRNGWAAPQEPFLHQTTMQHDFQGKNTLPAKSARPEYRRTGPERGPFEGTTTHNEAFKMWNPSPRGTCKPNEAYQSPKVPFAGESTFQSHFKAHPSCRRDPYIPKEGGLQTSGSQEFSTNYKDTYTAKSIPPCPAKYLTLRQTMKATDSFSYSHDMNGHQFFEPMINGFDQMHVNALA